MGEKMKAFATKEKGSVPAVGKRHDTHHPIGPVQLTQQAEIRSILRSSGAQTKLTVGQPDDPCEKEADRVADAVMRMPDEALQRQPLEEEEEMLQTKPADREECRPDLQRQVEEEEEEELLQPKRDGSGAMEVTPDLEQEISSGQGGGQQLPEKSREFFEPRMGLDLGRVKVHSDAQTAALTRQINARAFTLGSDIYFDAGQFAPESFDGKKLLAHELAHVAQQGSAEDSDQQRGNQRLFSKKDIRIQRRELASLTGDYEGIAVKSFTIEEWQTFLKSADEFKKAIALNAFMAKSLDRTVFDQDADRTDRATQAAILDKMLKPTEPECVDLMCALLSTKGLDLREIGSAEYVTGFLLPRFVEKYYASAIEKLTQKARSEKDGWAKYAIDPAAVSELLDEAGDVFPFVPHMVKSPGIGRGNAIVPGYDRSKEVGATGPRELSEKKPLETMMAQAISGAVATATAAIGCALAGESPGEWSKFRDRVEMHARVVSGVIKEVQRIEDLNKMIMDLTINLAFAALGPLASNVVVFGKKVQATAEKELRETLTEGMFKAAALEFTKDRVLSLGSSLSGLSAEQLKTDLQNQFNNELHEYERVLREKDSGAAPKFKIKGWQWRNITNVFDLVKGAFYFHT